MPQKTKKIILIALFLAIIAGFFVSGLHKELTLESLKELKEHFKATYEASPVMVISVYMLIYIATTAFSLPGATVLTLTGGAALGFIPGLIVTSFASTIGATLAFLASRYLFRDWVQDKFGERLKKINDGVEKEGVLYLFALRLTVVVPFFLINLLMALTPMKTWKFYLGSQIAMLPGTILYVYAGLQLGQIESVSDVLSPGLIIAFAMLGIFPLLTKKAVEKIRGKKMQTMSEQS